MAVASSVPSKSLSLELLLPSMKPFSDRVPDWSLCLRPLSALTLRPAWWLPAQLLSRSFSLAFSPSLLLLSTSLKTVGTVLDCRVLSRERWNPPTLLLPVNSAAEKASEYFLVFHSLAAGEEQETDTWTCSGRSAAVGDHLNTGIWM